MNTSNVSASHKIHLEIAETGKLFALKGKHQEALRYYRDALRLAVSSKAPEVFFRHYTQCVLESLELTCAYDEIIRFCTDADAHYGSLNLSAGIHRRDHGSILERLGLVYLKSGNTESGQSTLQKAQNITEKGALPVTEEILGWLKRGFTVNVDRILSSQRKHKYFVVRPDQVDRKRARPLSEAQHNAIPDPSKTLSV